MNTVISGAILAGGRATRMGGDDKGLRQVAGHPLYWYAVQRLQPQVSSLHIIANRNLHSYAESGFPVYPDSTPDFPGPLAGMLTALQHCSTEYVVCVPCDSPLLPRDLVARFAQQIGDASCAIAHDGERAHPVFALLHRRLLPAISASLQQGERRLMAFFQQQHAVTVDFSDQAAAFVNVNTPYNCMMIKPELEKLK
ncbi:molybdenum cofactor guanylyltransferase MobA [Plesiomonas sp. ZOR0011]|uniref:molybdenum cofactor guanylyltransferase MobA n=1 Tax=Plesiomonas sp. ZOR0011 TaxID=1339230 RepID=UPI000647E67C|nr:molybdenum cofactor guanylyltransferase MobA [Plesiomonas sp. ZOR0011]